MVVVAENRYFNVIDGLGEFDVLDGVGGLTVEGWDGGTV